MDNVLTQREMDLIRIAKENFSLTFRNNLLEKGLMDLVKSGVPVNDDDELVDKSFDLITSQLNGMISEINLNTKTGENNYYGSLRKLVEDYTSKEAVQRDLFIKEHLIQNPQIREEKNYAQLNKLISDVFKPMSFTVEDFLNNYTNEKKLLFSVEEENIIDEVKSKVVDSITETEKKNELYSTIIDETEAVKKEYGDNETFGSPKTEEDPTAATTDDGSTEEGGEEGGSGTEEGTGSTTEEGGEEGGSGIEEDASNESLRLNLAYEDYTDVSNNPVQYDPRAIESFLENVENSLEDQKKDYIKSIENILQNEKDQINQMTQNSDLPDEKKEEKVITATDDDIINSTETDEDIIKDSSEALTGFSYLVEKVIPRTALKFLDTKVYSPESYASFLIKFGNTFSPKDKNFRLIDGISNNLESITSLIAIEDNSNLLKYKHQKIKENLETAKQIILKYGSINSKIGINSDGSIESGNDIITLAIAKNILNRNYIADESLRKCRVTESLKITDETSIALEDLVDMKFDLIRAKSLISKSNNIAGARENVAILEGDLLNKIDNMDPLADVKKLDNIDRLLADAQYKRYMDVQSLYKNYGELLERNTESKISLSEMIGNGSFKKHVIERLETRLGKESVEQNMSEIDMMITEGVGFTNKTSFEKLLLKNLYHIKQDNGGNDLSVEDRLTALTRTKTMLTLFETLNHTGAMVPSIKQQFNSFINS